MRWNLLSNWWRRPGLEKFVPVTSGSKHEAMVENHTRRVSMEWFQNLWQHYEYGFTLQQHLLNWRLSSNKNSIKCNLRMLVFIWSIYGSVIIISCTAMAHSPLSLSCSPSTSLVKVGAGLIRKILPFFIWMMYLALDCIHSLEIGPLDEPMYIALVGGIFPLLYLSHFFYINKTSIYLKSVSFYSDLHLGCNTRFMNEWIETTITGLKWIVWKNLI